MGFPVLDNMDANFAVREPGVGSRKPAQPIVIPGGISRVDWGYRRHMCGMYGHTDWVAYLSIAARFLGIVGQRANPCEMHSFQASMASRWGINSRQDGNSNRED